MMERIRECTESDCDWKGTRSEAIKGTRGDWRCPECLGKIQNDYELSRNGGRKFDGEDLEEKIVDVLHGNGGLDSREILWRINGNSTSKFHDLTELHYKLSEMMKDDIIYSLGSIHGRGRAKFFLESDFVADKAIKGG